MFSSCSPQPEPSVKLTQSQLVVNLALFFDTFLFEHIAVLQGEVYVRYSVTIYSWSVIEVAVLFIDVNS